jgi:MoaA/NifB/PqqE/SkfB family radical SAM enzyme
MSILHPFIVNLKNIGTQYFDNSNRVARVFYRLKTYYTILRGATRKGVAVKSLLLTQFPFHFDDAVEPPIVSIEFTNHCNLKCVYCSNILKQRVPGNMSEAIFEKVLNDLKSLRPNRIQLVGNGESTLHPAFGEYIARLATTGSYISLVTNAQWHNLRIAQAILKAPVDLLEVSVDAGGKKQYETSRVNASYERLLSNLEFLKNERNRMKSKTRINIRLMIRPSQRNHVADEFKFWHRYGDRVMPQYVTKINNIDYQEDVFLPIQNCTEAFPKCSLPFKHMEIKYTGQVLMCYYSFFQMGPPGLEIGNVTDSSIAELWNSPVMKEYREAHRKRNYQQMPICRGCPGT